MKETEAEPTSHNPLLNSICDVPGIEVGHADDQAAKTGCTVVVPQTPAIAGVDVRGAAPGTREIEAIKPVRLINHCHAILLSGGSAFGLNAAGGVQQFLEEQDIGFDAGVVKVPIVPTAVIFDLATGDPSVRPDHNMGYAAMKAKSAKDDSCGCIGAGTGATVGKVTGIERAMRGGIGQASAYLGNGLFVGALAVVNAFGDIIDPSSAKIVAGARTASGEFLNTAHYLKKGIAPSSTAWSNTTLVIVATNAKLTKEEATKVAQMAHDGLARTINPVHTIFDGDITFALSCGDVRGNPMILGTVAAELTANSILRASRVSNQHPFQA